MIICAFTNPLVICLNRLFSLVDFVLPIQIMWWYLGEYFLSKVEIFMLASSLFNENDKGSNLLGIVTWSVLRKRKRSIAENSFEFALSVEEWVILVCMDYHTSHTFFLHRCHYCTDKRETWISQTNTSFLNFNCMRFMVTVFALTLSLNTIFSILFCTLGSPLG